MDVRLVAERTVIRPCAKKRYFYCVIPSMLVKALGVDAKSHITWTGSGRYRRVTATDTPSGDSCGSLVRTEMRIRIPKCAKLDVDEHDSLQWFIGAENGGKFGIYAAKKTGRPVAKKAPRRPGKFGTIRLATTTVSKINDKKWFHVQTAVPKVCIDVLDAAGTTHVKWEKAGSYYRMVPATGNVEDSRKLTRAFKRSGDFHFISYLPKDVASDLYVKKGSRVEWQAAADGQGNWEVMVGPVAGT